MGKRVNPLHRLLILGALGGLLVSSACTPLDDAMATIFGRSMRDQASFDPYEDPLPAPVGSVPFASGNLPSAPGEVNLGQPEGLEGGDRPFTQLDVLNESEVVMGLENPVAATEASLDRGEELFLRFCVPCHGADGTGMNPMAIAGVPPYSLVSDAVVAQPDGYLFGMIRVGKNFMPAYGHRISYFDRWNIVNDLRVLQGVATSPVQAEGSGDQTEGEPAGSGGASSN
jgi:mono/diheme cytochrome c family protein